jgi:hypothetical protein
VLRSGRAERLRRARDARKIQIERVLEGAAGTTATRMALVPSEEIGSALDLGPAELHPLLDELQREGRIFRDSITGCYSSRETPWDRRSRGSGPYP